MNVAMIKFKRKYVLPVMQYFHNRELIKDQWNRINYHIENELYKRNKNCCKVDIWDDDIIPVPNCIDMLKKRLENKGFIVETIKQERYKTIFKISIPN